MDIRINPPAPYGSGNPNPDRNAMLLAMNEMKSTLAELEQCLQGHPPDLAQANRYIDEILQDVQKVNDAAGGDVDITPEIQQMMGIVQDAQTMIQSSDALGALLVMNDPRSLFSQDITNIYSYITGGTPEPPTPSPEWQAFFKDYSVYREYMYEFKVDLQKGDTEEANRIFGYVMTAAIRLLKDSGDDPLISPQVAQLLGHLQDINLLLQQNDYSGCLAILNQYF